jgi:hypothetical protein
MVVLNSLDHVLLIVLVVVAAVVLLLFIFCQEFSREKLVEFLAVLIVFGNNVIQIILADCLNDIVFCFEVVFETWIQEREPFVECVKSDTYYGNWLASFQILFDIFGDFDGVIL